MNNLKQLIINRFKIFSIVTASLVFSIVLLMIRMKLTHSFFYLFLVWNLFLAVIPFLITTYLVSNPKLSKFSIVLWFGIWLLFLPNAPYIITDLLHLKISTTHLLWLDILVVNAFALNGLILFFLSIIDMEMVLQRFIKTKKVNYIISAILLLTGFGVYLGRFLRYNSWEILSNPNYLLNDIINIIIQPFQHKEAWLFTLLFSAFLSIGFWVFKALHKSN